MRHSRQIPRGPRAQRVSTPAWLGSPSPRWDNHAEGKARCFSIEQAACYATKTSCPSLRGGVLCEEPGEGQAGLVTPPMHTVCLRTPEGVNLTMTPLLSSSLLHLRCCILSIVAMSFSMTWGKQKLPGSISGFQA